MAGQDGFEVHEGKGVGGGVEDLCVGGVRVGYSVVKDEDRRKGWFLTCGVTR